MGVLNHTGEYPPNWAEIAHAKKVSVAWSCERCKHEHDPATGHVLTVHHLDGDKSNVKWFNLAALCQRCHLSVQSRVDPGRPYFFRHSPWFEPYVAGLYADRLGFQMDEKYIRENAVEIIDSFFQFSFGFPYVVPQS